MVRHGSASAYVLMGTVSHPGALATRARARDLRARGAAGPGRSLLGARGDGRDARAGEQLLADQMPFHVADPTDRSLPSSPPMASTALTCCGMAADRATRVRRVMHVDVVAARVGEISSMIAFVVVVQPLRANVSAERHQNCASRARCSSVNVRRRGRCAGGAERCQLEVAVRPADPQRLRVEANNNVAVIARVSGCVSASEFRDERLAAGSRSSPAS